MAKFTIVWVILYVAGVIASFVNPAFGAVTYLFEYYLRPSIHWWGKGLPDLRWNFTIAAILCFTYVLRRSSFPPIERPRRGPGMCLVALLVLMTIVTPLFAVNKDSSWQSTSNYSKMILFHGLVVGTVRSEFAFDAVVGMHMAGAAWWGLEAWSNGKRSRGRLQNIGSGDTKGDNGTAAHLLTVLPFIAVYLLVHPDKKYKALAFLAAPLVINTIILCNSRGALVGLAVAAAYALWLARRGHRLRMIGATIGLALAVYALADPQFLNRQQNIANYETDGSAGGRIQAWRGSLALIADHPFGAGGQGFYELSPIYASELVERMKEKRDPHNTFVLVTSEWGIIGLALYLGYYLTSFWLLSLVRKRSPEGIWYYRSVAVQLAMIGIMVAGTFTDRLYAEAPYWMGALAVSLYRIQSDMLQKKQAATAEQRVATGFSALDRRRLAAAPVAWGRYAMGKRASTSV